jgi:hypothetical protein
LVRGIHGHTCASLALRPVLPPYLRLAEAKACPDVGDCIVAVVCFVVILISS